MDLCLFVCLSQVGVLLKRLNKRSCYFQTSKIAEIVKSVHHMCAPKSFNRIVLFYVIVCHAYMFIVLILPAYKWLLPFAADI